MKPFNNLTKQLLLFLMILTLSGSSGRLLAQTPLDKTSIGSEFKFVFLQNRILSEAHDHDPNLTEVQQTRMSANHGEISLWVTIANQESSAVDVRLYTNEVEGEVFFTPVSGTISHVNPGLSGEYWEVNIGADATKTIEITTADYNDIKQAQMMYNLLIQEKMITVKSATQITQNSVTRDALLTVYAESRQAQSRDAAMILPVQSLGSEYIAITGNRLYDDDNYPVDAYDNTGHNHGGPSEVAILAAEDITATVTIPDHVQDWEDLVERDLLASTLDFTQKVSNSRLHVFHLKAGEAIQLQSDHFDLTGIEISARRWYGALAGDYSKPVTKDPGLCAVFSGNMAAQIGYQNGDKKDAFDHVYEQMYPVETWGCEYIAVDTRLDVFFSLGNAPTPMGDRTADVYKIVAGYNGTVISTLEFGDINDGGTTLGTNIELNRGEYIVISNDRAYMPNGDDVLDVNGNPVLTSIQYKTSNPKQKDYHFHVNASLGITVAQFMVSQKNIDVVIGANYRKFESQDPSMVLLSPVDQTLTELDFVSMPIDINNGSQKTDYVMILAQSDRNDLLLDGAPITGTQVDYGTAYPPGVLSSYSWEQIPGTSWYFVIRSIANTSVEPEYHTISYTSGNTTSEGFLAYVYGSDFLESYFYAAGINAQIRRVFPGQEIGCLEPGDASSKHNSTYLNSLDLLRAEGGDGYSWDIVSEPSGSNLGLIGAILDDEDVAEPSFETSVEFTAVGTYVFMCTIERDGSCDLELTVEIVVPSCCAERDQSTYFQPQEAINEVVNWDDKVFISDNTTIILGPEAILKINNADVVFGQCAKIIVQAGAVLEANNSVFRACNPSSPWGGIYFESDVLVAPNNSSVFNECTFRNAVNAIHIENGESVGIHSNLFLNNYTGVNIEGQAETGDYSLYIKQISGNKFIVDHNIFEVGVACAFDNGEQIDEFKHYGIKVTGVQFLESIAHNEFNNTAAKVWQSDPFSIESKVFVGILSNTSFVKISNNTFAEMYHGVQVDNSKSRIIGNTFELNDMWEDKAQVDVRNSMVNTEIRSNEFTCWGDGLQYSSTERAIYLSDCENVAVVDNEITGFTIGILSVELRNTLISKNRILDAIEYGIYIKGTLGDPGAEDMAVSCNEIHMDFNGLNKPSVGICGDNLKGTSKITSNCIFDCMVSIFITRPTGEINVPAPEIKNNFMYNYDWAGIYFYDAANSDIAWIEKIRDNTYYSNSSAHDIYSNHLTNINVTNSFGLHHVESNVKIRSTVNSDFSRASCGAQIFRLGIPTDETDDFLDVGLESYPESYKCDNDYSSSLSGLTTAQWQLKITALVDTDLEGVPFGEGEYSAMLHEAARHEMIEEAGTIYEASQGSDLSDLAKVRLSFHYYVVLHNFDQARDVLTRANQYPELHRWIRLNAIRLTYIQSGLKKSAISRADMATLKELAQTLDYVGSGATTLLNTLSVGAKLKYIATADVEQPETLGRMSTISNRIEVYPNPSKTTIDIQFSFESSEIAEMTIVDIYGKEVDWMKPSYISATLNLDISQWESGFYFVNVTLENGELHSQKFVKI